MTTSFHLLPKNSTPSDFSVFERIFTLAVIIDQHLCQIDFLTEGIQHFSIDRILADKVDIMALLGLSSPMNTRLCLFKIRHGIIKRIKNHCARCSQCDAKTGCCNLSYKHTALFVILESMNFTVAVLYPATHNRMLSKYTQVLLSQQGIFLFFSFVFGS